MLSALATDLPATPAALIGRRQEREWARALLLDEAVPLLTLTGPGGVGKTRLALAIAHEVGDAFADGVAFVDLSPLTDPALVPDAIARALGLSNDGSQPLRLHLRGHLRPRQVLLVLDNCEHVLAAAAAATGDLLAGCPALQIVATSRSSLRLHAEHVLTLSPLAVETEDGGRGTGDGGFPSSEAVQLFVQRARQVRPEFALTEGNAADLAEIARRLDGLPLAIELAAARIRHLSPQALLARLSDRLTLLSGGPRDRPDRQQTLRDAIAWSYDLLDADEGALFRRLAVFSGGFTLDAVDAIGCWPLAIGSEEKRRKSEIRRVMSQQLTANSQQPTALDLLAALIDKSLLVGSDGVDGELRYGMLESIRAYGLDRLVASGEEPAARDRHATWCLSLADRTWWDLSRGEEAAWFDELEREHDNLRAALNWLAQSGQAINLLRLAGCLSRFWAVRSHRAEGRRCLERALLAADASVPPPILARATIGAAALARTHDDQAATRLAEDALALYRSLDDARGVAATLNLLGALARARGDSDLARGLGEEALTLCDALNDPGWSALVRCNLGVVAHWQGDDQRAEPLLEQALAAFRAQGDPWGIAFTLHSLATLAADAGYFARAAPLYQEGLAASQAAGVKESLVDALAGTAVVAVGFGFSDTGARLHGAAAALAESLGYTFEMPERDRYARSIAGARDALGSAAFATAWEDGRRLDPQQAADEAQRAIDAIVCGDDLASPLLTSLLPEPAEPFGLTPREREVLALMAERQTDPEIAARLFLSPRTVERHVSNILDKLGAANRREAAALAARYRLA